MAYFELGAKTQEEFNAKVKSISLTIEKKKDEVSKIENIDALFDFIKTFEQETQATRPITIYEKEAVMPEQIAFLEENNYPADYIQWVKKYGQYEIYIEAALILHIENALEEGQNYYDLLPANNYRIFAGDGAGNMFAFDNNKAENPIRFFDHNEYTNTDTIEDIYSEVYDFYEDEEQDSGFNNSNALNPALIFDEEGEYKMNSSYIQDYLKDASREEQTHDFLSFAKAKILEGFEQIINRYN